MAPSSHDGSSLDVVPFPRGSFPFEQRPQVCQPVLVCFIIYIDLACLILSRSLVMAINGLVNLIWIYYIAVINDSN